MEEKTCPTCGTKFLPRTYRHIHCCRNCFKKAYRKKMKEEHNPNFVCPSCGKKTELKFSPIINFKKWQKFKCSCGYTPCGPSPEKEEDVMEKIRRLFE